MFSDVDATSFECVGRDAAFEREDVMGKMTPKWRRRLLVAAAFMFLIPSLGRAQTRNAAPEPLGTLVDVGGHRVHLYCVGNGSLTAVITGAGYSFDWGLVQPETNSLECAPTIIRDRLERFWSDGYVLTESRRDTLSTEERRYHRS